MYKTFVAIDLSIESKVFLWLRGEWWGVAFLTTKEVKDDVFNSTQAGSKEKIDSSKNKETIKRSKTSNEIKTGRPLGEYK